MLCHYKAVVNRDHLLSILTFFPPLCGMLRRSRYEFRFFLNKKNKCYELSCNLGSSRLLSFFSLVSLHNGWLLLDIILLTQCYYRRGTRLNAMKRFCLCSLCHRFHLNVLTFFSLAGGCSESLDAFRFFFIKYPVVQHPRIKKNLNASIQSQVKISKHLVVR